MALFVMLQNCHTSPTDLEAGLPSLLFWRINTLLNVTSKYLSHECVPLCCHLRQTVEYHVGKASINVVSFMRHHSHVVWPIPERI
jgi:hypothetical protein